MRSTFRIIIAALALGGLTVAPATAQARPHVRITVPPPVWVPAHWTVQMGRNVYISGRWAAPPPVAATWVPGRWVGHGRDRHYVRGHWR